MKNLSLYSVLIATFSVFQSCSSIYIIGNDFNDLRVPEISVGNTDKSQILGMFGDPSLIGLINHYEVYSYSYDQYNFPPISKQINVIDRKVKTLVVVFDKNEKVKTFAYNWPSGISLDILLMEKEMQKKQENEDSSSIDN